MNKFIYVFNEQDKDILLANKYRLLKADKKNNMYIFENTSGVQLSFSDMRYVLSDILTF